MEEKYCTIYRSKFTTNIIHIGYYPLGNNIMNTHIFNKIVYFLLKYSPRLQDGSDVNAFVATIIQ